ncbi:MAG: hypothetical protein FWE20_01050 [Defluviitaleaceae bacterium]|nr:hypothetical protein [Defluviitaleaceae bacterium]
MSQVISEVVVISIDKNDDIWAVEGEVFFESDLSAAFSVSYSLEYDELEDFEIEIDCKFDKKVFKEMLVEAAHDYED